MAKGSKFDAMKRRLAKEPGVTDPGALAASIGRKKFGANVMEKASAAHMPAATMRAHMKSTKGK